MDTLFLVLSKTTWVLIRPETLLVLLFVLPLLLLWRRRISAAFRALLFVLAVTMFIGLVPVGYLVLNPLERAYAPNPELSAPTGIIVLGGMEDIAPAYTGKIAQVNHAGERLIVTYELAQRFPEAKVLYSGGRVILNPDSAPGIQVGPKILRRLGLPDARLIVENRSRTTAENAVLAREKVPDQSAGPWVLVTSAFHMPRALGTFCAAGWRDLIPYPTDYRGGNLKADIKWDLAEHLIQLNTGVKEWIGLAAYKVTDRTKAFLPAGC